MKEMDEQVIRKLDERLASLEEKGKTTYVEIVRELEDFRQGDEINDMFIKLLLKKLEVLEKRVGLLENEK